MQNWCYCYLHLRGTMNCLRNVFSVLIGKFRVRNLRHTVCCSPGVSPAGSLLLSLTYLLWTYERGSKRRQAESHNLELHKFQIALHQILLESSYYGRWYAHVARMIEMRNAYKILVCKPEGKIPLGRLRQKCEDIPPLPNTPSWRGAQLKHRENFTLILILKWILQK